MPEAQFPRRTLLRLSEKSSEARHRSLTNRRNGSKKLYFATRNHQNRGPSAISSTFSDSLRKGILGNPLNIDSYTRILIGYGAYESRF